jgi:1,4-alpha-glucan branching enzyme
MGQEFGQLSEWSADRGLDWWLLDQPTHAQLLQYVAALNRVYRAQPALWERDHDPDAFTVLGAPEPRADVLAFSRRDHDGGRVVALCNFAGTPVADYRVNLPAAGTWREILNSDATEFGGSGVGNLGAVTTDAEGTATLVLPPLGALWLQRTEP